MIDDYRRNRRAERAASLTAAIMNEIGDLVGNNRQDVAKAIDNLLWRLGVDPLTDSHREAAGLPLRDNKGWTREEIYAYEAHLTHAMLRPPAPMIWPAPTPSPTPEQPE